VIGGDFNIVVTLKKKSNGDINQKWADLFKEMVNMHGLVELKNSARAFTWTNNQEIPIMAALDKILCTTSFEQKFPLAFVSVKARETSDHVPLILNFGIRERKKPSLFRFEKWWLEQVDFKELVFKTWATPCAFTDALDIWQFKVRLMRKKVRGWAINVNANIKKLKKSFLRSSKV
jgi:hypothetical protein